MAIGHEMQVLGHKNQGIFGDPAGFEEILFVTKESSYVLLAQGGYASDYPGVTIRQLSKTEARSWLSDLLGKQEAETLIPTQKRASKKASKPASKTTKTKASK